MPGDADAQVRAEPARAPADRAEATSGETGAVGGDQGGRNVGERGLGPFEYTTTPPST